MMDMNGKVDHPTIRDILGFRGGGAGTVSLPDVGEHIATCDRCHSRYREVMRFEKEVAEALPEGVTTPSCPEDWEIAALVAKEAGGDAAARLSAHLQGCPSCIDRAAWYHKAFTTVPVDLKTPLAWKQEAIRVLEEGSRKAAEPEIGLFARLREFLQRMAAPLPPLPGYATAFVAIALLVWVSTAEREKILVIPSTEKIASREAEPSGAMGFMGEGEDQAVSRMKISVKRDSVHFRWGPIENLSAASFNLIEKSTRETVFRLKDITGTEVSVSKRLIETGKVYVWSIEGRTADGRILEYSGEVFSEKR